VEGRGEGRIEYIWHTTTYVGRHVSCLEGLNEMDSMDSVNILLVLVFEVVVNSKL
jgi:hypothetical protein